MKRHKTTTENNAAQSLSQENLAAVQGGKTFKVPKIDNRQLMTIHIVPNGSIWSGKKQGGGN